MNTSHSFGTAPSTSLGTQMKIQLLESSLSKLFECLALECSCRKLVHPQWKHFKSMKLTWEDRIRLNNALWRCWHIQYLKGKRPKFCGYVTPMTGESHSRSRAVVLEGKYWRRRLEAVANEYKNWRVFYKNRSRTMNVSTSASNDSIVPSIGAGSRDAAASASAQQMREIKAEPAARPSDVDTAFWTNTLDEHDTMQLISSYSDTLFSSLVGNYSRLEDSGGFADVIQPRLNMVQHSLYDVMGTSFDVPSPREAVDPLNSVLSGPEGLWKNSTSSSAMQSGLPLPPLPIDPKPMHTPMDTSAAVTPAGGATAASADGTGMSDAHMAAQQLILLMSSGKEADSSTLKHLQMLLQSASGTPAGTPGTGPTAIASQGHQQPPPQQQQQHMSPLRSHPSNSASPVPPLIPFAAASASASAHGGIRTNSPHGSAAGTSEAMVQSEYHQLDSYPHIPGQSASSQLATPLSATPSLLSNTPRQSRAFFGGSASAGATSFEPPPQAQSMDPYGARSPMATPVKSDKGLPIVGKEERRKLHITAEQKRRVHIRNGFDELQALVPSVSGQSTKISKAVLLQKSVEHMRHLQQEKKAGDDELDRLRAEVAQLNDSITQCQDQLPVTGAPITRTRLDYTQQLFDHYVNIRTQSNYKFWIFSMIVRSLFDAYNSSVSTMSEDEMCRSVLNWFDHHCSLRALRPAVLSSLRQLSTSTSVLSDPTKLAAEATAAALAAAAASSAAGGGASPVTVPTAAAQAAAQQPNAAAADAARAAAVAALASTFQPGFQASAQQQQHLGHVGQASQQQQQQQSQLQTQMQQLSYFADGGLPFHNPAFK